MGDSFHPPHTSFSNVIFNTVVVKWLIYSIVMYILQYLINTLNTVVAEKWFIYSIVHFAVHCCCGFESFF